MLRIEPPSSNDEVAFALVIIAMAIIECIALCFVYFEG